MASCVLTYLFLEKYVFGVPPPFLSGLGKVSPSFVNLNNGQIISKYDVKVLQDGVIGSDSGTLLSSVFSYYKRGFLSFVIIVSIACFRTSSRVDILLFGKY